MALGKEKFNALMLKGLRRAGETHSLDDVVQALHRGHMQVLYNADAAIVTQEARFGRVYGPGRAGRRGGA